MCRIKLAQLPHFLFLSLLVTLSQGIMNCQARTLLEYERERDQARVDADNAQHRRAIEATKRAERARAQRDQKAVEKRDLIARGKTLVEASGNKKFQIMKDELRWVKRQSQLFSQATTNYLEAQRQSNERIKKWRAQWRVYQSTESARKAELREGLSASRSATLAKQLVEPHQRLRDLRKTEIAEASALIQGVDSLIADVANDHGRYLLALEPIAQFLEKYHLTKIARPSSVESKLISLKAYIQARSHFFAEQSARTIAQIESQMNFLMVDHVDSVMSELERKELQSTLAAAFLDTVNQLIEKQSEVMAKVQVPFGCGQSLKPLHDFYKEALVFKGQCADLDTLRRTNSIYFTGCRLLASTLFEAQSFMDDGAIQLMRMTEALARIEERPALLVALRRLSDGLGRDGTLVQKIHLHDDLIQQWKEVLAGEDV